jgi:DNA-binding transcriptional LysR family regulator
LEEAAGARRKGRAVGMPPILTAEDGMKGIAAECTFVDERGGGLRGAGLDDPRGTVEVAGLEASPFRVDRFVLLIAPNHPLSTADRIAFADELDFHFVGLDRASALQRFLSEKSDRIGRRLKLRVQLRSFDAVCRLVECNVGIGVVPVTTA